MDDGVLAPVERGDVLTLSAESVESESVTRGQAFEHLDLAGVIRIVEDDSCNQVGKCRLPLFSGRFIQPGRIERGDRFN